MRVQSLKTRRRFPLSLRISLLLMLAALLPLTISTVSGELLSRPLLISQANTAMDTDAQAHIQAIENYFSQPIIDVSSLSHSPLLSDFLLGASTTTVAAATEILATGYQRNVHYINWSLIDMQGKQRLSYPAPALPHGKFFIPPDTIAQLDQPNRALVSSAFFDPNGNHLTVDITEPITAPTATRLQVIGILRATLDINFIWNVVLSERGVNGAGSTAFLLDQNGVIIANTDMAQTFSAIKPFTPEIQQDIDTLQRYGDIHIPVVAYNAVSMALQNGNTQSSFQMVPPGQKESFQVISRALPIVPWTYFVLSPSRVVTAIADQQLLTIAIIASIILFLAALTGLVIGRRITAPVLHSVTNLQVGSQSLKDLAAKEQTAATEQSWVVDSSRTGLTSLQYYISATQVGVQHMMRAGSDLQHRLPPKYMKEAEETLNDMAKAAHYIEKALQYQKEGSQKLSATLELTQQVTDQLTSGADSVTQVAEQMEQVVSQLYQVVGKE